MATKKEVIHSDCGGSIVTEVNFSPDGKLLAVAVLLVNEVHLWNPNAGTLVAVLKGLRGGAFSAAFSPDGRTLASNGLEVKLWNIPTLLEVATIPEEGTNPWYLAFLPDGLGLAVGHGKKNKYTSVWRAPSLAEIERIESRK